MPCLLKNSFLSWQQGQLRGTQVPGVPGYQAQNTTAEVSHRPSSCVGSCEHTEHPVAGHDL
eukprot:3517785-Rhodomonas_salina.1